MGTKGSRALRAVLHCNFCDRKIHFKYPNSQLFCCKDTICIAIHILKSIWEYSLDGTWLICHTDVTEITYKYIVTCNSFYQTVIVN